MDADLQYNIEVFCKKIMSVLTIPTMRIDLYITHNKEIFLDELTGTAGAKKKLQGTEVGSYRTGINIPELDPMCFMDKYLGYLLIQQNDTRYFNFN